MFLKQNIPKIKKVLQYLTILAIALTVALSINTIQAHAYDFSGWAKSIVDSQGADGTASVGSVPYGVSTSKTGYLCYLLDKNGNAVPGTDAIALSSSGFSFYPGSREWIAESRLGGYVAGQFNGTADWSCTPWTSAGNDSYPTNEPTIRAWFESVDGNNNQGGTKFVFKNWQDKTEGYIRGDYVIVIETLMHFQYSEKSSSGVTRTAEEVYKSLRKQYSEMPAVAMISQAPSTVQDAWYAGSLSENQLRKELLAALKNLYEKDPSSFEKREPEGWNPIGPCKLIGTPANMIKYRNTVLKSNTNVFNKFTHKIACFAEYIQSGNIGEQIGFTAWNGSTSSQLTDQQVQDYGVAMMVISAKNSAQTTCDEPQQPSPHKAPKESTGDVTIVKNYRTKEGSNLTDDGCFTITNVSSDITVESEQKYQVVGWATSSSASTIDSITWSVTSPIKQGTTPTTVTLESTEKCLYVLLEKTEEPEPEAPADYNYKLTESSITRRVFFTNPDNRLTLPYIENHTFKWIIPAHQTSCPGNHPFTDACHGQHIGPHTASCPTACSSTCTKEHTHSDGCSDPHYYDCGTRCTTQTAYCSGWQWHEQNLKLSINNTQQSNYPDILADKQGWNAEVKNGHSLKHYYLNDASFTRDSTASQSYEESNWDYICVLMRGKDKLTIAHWQNAGTGSGLTTAANTDLQGVSKSGFTIANTDSGERIKNKPFYMETFNAYFNTEESEGVDNRTYYKSTIHATVPAPDTPRGSTLCGINQRKAYISNPLSINNIKVRIK